MSKSIVIPDDCDLHKTYTHGRSQGGARSHGPQMGQNFKGDSRRWKLLSQPSIDPNPNLN